MRTIRNSRNGFAWLEVLLALTVVAFTFQMFPSLWFGLLRALDFRNWSRGVWMSLNLGIVFVLFGIRFGPGLYDTWRERRTHLAIEREKHENRRLSNQQHELFERLREARKRQVV